MRPMRWVGDVDQSEFQHACQSALSLNYLYDNDLCQQYEYDTCNKYFDNNIIHRITTKPLCLKWVNMPNKLFRLLFMARFPLGGGGNRHQNKLNNTKKSLL